MNTLYHKNSLPTNNNSCTDKQIPAGINLNPFIIRNAHGSNAITKGEIFVPCNGKQQQTVLGRFIKFIYIPTNNNTFHDTRVHFLAKPEYASLSVRPWWPGRKLFPMIVESLPIPAESNGAEHK